MVTQEQYLKIVSALLRVRKEFRKMKEQLRIMNHRVNGVVEGHQWLLHRRVHEDIVININNPPWNVHC